LELGELDAGLEVPAPRAHGRFAIAVVAWLAAMAVGFGLLWQYAATPGGAAPAPERWPDATPLLRAQDRATLLMFAHPECACTRASLAELARVMTRAGDRVAARVVFVQPEGAPASWAESGLVARAREIQGVEVDWDPGGREAERFGAVTSGDVFLYAADGALLFRGGITARRGHEGENASEARLLDALARSAPSDPGAVFGCGLEDEDPIREGGP
jgi:hypothetical protein